MKTEIPAVTARNVTLEDCIKVLGKPADGKFFSLTERQKVAASMNYEFTPSELQRMDDDRSEREVYRMEEARDDNSNPPEVEK